MPTSEDVRLLYAGGVAYYESALLISSNPACDGRDHLILPTHNSIGLSIEMLFKAVLSHKGISESCLRNSKLGHNLSALRAKAQEQNFATSVTGVSEIIDHIGTDYTNHHFRYPKVNSELKTVDVTAALKAVDLFIDEIANVVGLPLRPELH
jgi:hypothetical protein